MLTFDKELAISLRAALLQQAQALQDQRAAVLKQVAELERAFEIGKEKKADGKKNPA